MKKAGTVLLVLTLTSMITATTAFAQAGGPVWTVDENGPALLNGPLVGFANGSYKVDPISGLMGWYYPLGPSIPGDLVLQEPPSTNAFSDILRFDGNGVFFFSDAEAGETNLDKADVFQLPPLVTSPNYITIFRVENGPEGNNGFLWTPGPGQPGFDTSGQLAGLSYNIISDAVPEPQGFVLLAAGLWLLVWQKARAQRLHFRRP
jgi:hypothetical protein